MTYTVYFWQDKSGAWQLARKTPAYQNVGTRPEDTFTIWLVQHLYSNRQEWVPESKLSVYHGDNQPEGE